MEKYVDTIGKSATVFGTTYVAGSIVGGGSFGSVVNVAGKAVPLSLALPALTAGSSLISGVASDYLIPKAPKGVAKYLERDAALVNAGIVSVGTAGLLKMSNTEQFSMGNTLATAGVAVIGDALGEYAYEKLIEPEVDTFF